MTSLGGAIALRFEMRDYVSGAAFTALYITAGVVEYILVTGVAGILAGIFTGLWSRDQLGSTAVIGLYVLVVTTLVAAFLSTLVSLAIGAPVAFVVGLALKSVTRWTLHLLAFFGLGALCALGICAIYSAGGSLEVSVISVGIFTALVAISAALGWLTAWRRRARRLNEAFRTAS